MTRTLAVIEAIEGNDNDKHSNKLNGNPDTSQVVLLFLVELSHIRLQREQEQSSAGKFTYLYFIWHRQQVRGRIAPKQTTSYHSPLSRHLPPGYRVVRLSGDRDMVQEEKKIMARASLAMCVSVNRQATSSFWHV